MPVPTNGSKYDMRINPVYQVDWLCESKGKRIASTKRRVQFRFGFSDAEAIAAGESGPSCRGEEHEVVLVWSITSGKRMVTADGEEIHYAKGSVSDHEINVSWTMAGGHTVKIIAHVAPPMYPPPGFRQYDLHLDGCSFFDMPQIYELGDNNKKFSLPASVEVQKQLHHRTSLETSPTYASDKSDSTVSTQNSSPPQSPKEESTQTIVVDLLSLDASPTPTNDFIEYDVTIPTNDAFAPVAISTAEPSFALISNQIMSTYYPVNQEWPALPYEPQPVETPIEAQTQDQSAWQSTEQYTYNNDYNNNNNNFETNQQPNRTLPSHQNDPQFQLTMEPLDVSQIDSSPQASPFESAVKNLVNLDNIGETEVSPEQKKFQEKRNANQAPKSKPQPPKLADWKLGLKPCIGDIQANSGPKAAPKKEIMRTHAFDPAAAQAGMMVVHGSTPSPSYQQYQQQGYYGQQQQQQQQQYCYGQ